MVKDEAASARLKKGAVALALIAGLIAVRFLSGEKPVVEPPRPAPPTEAEIRKKLTITDTVKGTGKEAVKGKILSVKYRGTLQDGTVFDETKKGAKPFTFPLGGGQVIPGWDVGMVGMKVGGKRRLVVPPEAAYGDEAKGPIPGGSTLTFDVELVDVLDSMPIPTPPPLSPTPKPKAGAKTSGAAPAPATKLVVQDLKVGSGPAAKEGDAVEVDYRGRLQDGTIFDESYKRGETFSFHLGAGEVIKGWDQGVAGMKVGGKRKLTIPADLAYGSQGQGMIPPGATLIFEVELRSLNNDGHNH